MRNIGIAVLVIISCFGISYGAERDIKAITATMDAYEKQIDSIKLSYSYETGIVDQEGNREFVKGTFAQKKSEGCILLDEITQKGKTWDEDKEPEGIMRSYNGKITRYLDHGKNKRGYHMAALYQDHNPKLYKTNSNPYYHVVGSNYTNRFTDLLSDPNGMAKIQGEELVNGSKTIKVTFKAAKGAVEYHLWLLPEKNYLPAKLEFYNMGYKDGTQRLVETHWGDFKEFPGGIWYPMTIKSFYKDVKDPVTIKIEGMDISPLTKKDFEFKFPAMTHVTDQLKGTSYETTK